MCKLTTLDKLPIGGSGIIKCFTCAGDELRRLQTMGMCRGVKVCPVQSSPSGDPRAYLFRGVVIALRSSDAQHVSVLNQSE